MEPLIFEGITVVPGPALAWLAEWGLFSALCALAVSGLGLALRRFWLWRRGTSEVLTYLKSLSETSFKTLLELERLNRLLGRPLKKASGAPATGPAPEFPSSAPALAEVPPSKKQALLAALAAQRTRLTQEKAHDPSEDDLV